MSALTRYSVVTPKRPDATCLIAERIEYAVRRIGLKRSLSSPPSPVLDLPPIPVHRDRQRGVGFARDRAEAHGAGGAKSLGRCPGRLDLSSGTGLRFSSSELLIRNRPRQGQQPLGLLVEDFRERLVALLRIAAHGMPAASRPTRRSRRVLRRGCDRHTRRPTSSAVLYNRRLAEGVGVAARGFLGDLRQAHAFDGGCGCRRNIWRRNPPSIRRRRRSARRNRTDRSRCPSSTSPSAGPCRST